MSLLEVFFGTVLLAYGRKVFWLFVGVLGFSAGLSLAENTLHAPAWLSLPLAIAIGLAAAVFAVVLQKTGIGLAGLLAGGYLTLGLVQALNLNLGNLTWLLVVIGSILGAFLLLAIFDWTMIILSALVGAGMIVQTLSLPTIGAFALFVALAAAGIIIQGKMMQKD